MFQLKLGKSALLGLGVLALASAPLVTGGAGTAEARPPRSTQRERKIIQAPRSDRGYLGVSVQRLRRGLREAFDIPEDVDGLLVSNVGDDTPAEKGGIRNRDVITRFDGKSVGDEDDFTRMVRSLKPGTRVDVTVWRNGQTRDLSVTLEPARDVIIRRWTTTPDDEQGLDRGGPAPPEPPLLPRFLEVSRHGYLGVQLQDLNEEIAPYFSAPDAKGALVWEVIDSGPAEEAGLKGGDVIIELEGQEIRDSQDLRDALSDHDPGETVGVTFLRQGRTQTASVTLGKSPQATDVFIRSLRGPRFQERLDRRGNLDGAMQRLKQEMERLQERLNNLKEELERLKD